MSTVTVTLFWGDDDEWEVTVDLPGVPAVGDQVTAAGVFGTVKSRGWDTQGVNVYLADANDYDFQRVASGELPPESIGLLDDWTPP